MEEARESRTINWYRTPLGREQLRELNRPSDLKAGLQVIGHLSLKATFSAIVEHANHISLRQASSPRVGSGHPDLLSAVDLAFQAGFAVVPLGMETGLWLIRNHVQWISVGVPEPFRGLEPGWMGRTVRIPKALDCL